MEQVLGFPAQPVVGVPPFYNVAPDKHLPGMPGTASSLALRLSQLVFAVGAFSVMGSVDDFDSVTAFCYLVAATALQGAWSLFMGFTDCYALFFSHKPRKSTALSLIAFGDWLTATLTLAAACSSAGITVLLERDLDQCGPNDCGKFQAAVAVTFMSWFLTSISFFISFWLSVSK